MMERPVDGSNERPGPCWLRDVESVIVKKKNVTIMLESPSSRTIPNVKPLSLLITPNACIPAHKRLWDCCNEMALIIDVISIMRVGIIMLILMLPAMLFHNTIANDAPSPSNAFSVQ